MTMQVMNGNKKHDARKVTNAIERARSAIQMFEAEHGATKNTTEAFELLSDAVAIMVDERMNA